MIAKDGWQQQIQKTIMDNNGIDNGQRWTTTMMDSDNYSREGQ